MRKRLSTIRAAILTLSLLMALCCTAGAQYVVETRHTVLTFNSQEDMAKFNSAIKYGTGLALFSLFSSPTVEDTMGELSRKVDLLFEKVQQILDMRKQMARVRVRAYPDREQLHAAYRKIYKKGCTERGWYVYEFNTVFLNVEDVHEGMLAHELGHAIIDHYLEVRPPRATAEILAKYVDMHLHEEIVR